jgi:hypothetical protein
MLDFLASNRSWLLFFGAMLFMHLGHGRHGGHRGCGGHSHGGHQPHDSTATPPDPPVSRRVTYR